MHCSTTPRAGLCSRLTSTSSATMDLAEAAQLRQTMMACTAKKCAAFGAAAPTPGWQTAASRSDGRGLHRNVGHVVVLVATPVPARHPAPLGGPRSDAVGVAQLGLERISLASGETRGGRGCGHRCQGGWGVHRWPLAVLGAKRQPRRRQPGHLLLGEPSLAVLEPLFVDPPPKLDLDAVVRVHQLA
mmetsp:Transcript_28722/g.86216  ORF Transcript_28722/g.86216 Transcript_28722/m.86216 type:complete len:187 (-) Transcript_28722:1329-1889(-)